LGNAPGFEDEYATAKSVAGDVPTFAVNRSAYAFECEYWATIHPRRFFCDENRAIKISDRHLPEVEMPFPIHTQGGTSSLFAAIVALVMGFDKVVTAGVPMLGDYRMGQGRWLWYKEQINDRVRSVSPHGTFITDKFGRAF